MANIVMEVELYRKLRNKQRGYLFASIISASRLAGFGEPVANLQKWRLSKPADDTEKALRFLAWATPDYDYLLLPDADSRDKGITDIQVLFNALAVLPARENDDIELDRRELKDLAIDGAYVAGYVTGLAESEAKKADFAGSRGKLEQKGFNNVIEQMCLDAGLPAYSLYIYDDTKFSRTFEAVGE